MGSTAPPESIGQRIAACRKLAGLHQVDLAQRTHYSLSMVRAVEQGREPASAPFIAAVSRVLGVLPQELTSQPYTALLAQEGATLAGAQELQELLAEGPLLRADQPSAHDDLLKRLERLRADRHHDRSRNALAQTPVLLRQLHGAVQQAGSDHERETTWRMLADAYANTAQLAYRFGMLTMASALLDRMEHASDLGGSTLRTAQAAQHRALLLLSHAAYDTGQRFVERSLDVIGSTGDEQQQVLAGSAHLRGAVLAARNLDLDRARTHLAEAHRLAELVGYESPVLDTNFGPGNVAIHRVAVELEAGDPGRAAHEGASLRLPAGLKPTRAGRHWQDMGRAYLLSGEHAKALLSLQRARAMAPQQTRHHPQVHETIRALACTAGQVAPALSSFAHWLGVRV
jgi:transcriptional regulator with XRE-family HTH domain